MKLLFVRHAIAMERAEWSEDDLLRPLTEKGKERGRRAFAGLKRVCDPPDVILSSEATRAQQTARLLRRAFPTAQMLTDRGLNPGANLTDLRAALDGLDSKSSVVAIVGHEPDFSEMIAGILQSRGTAADEHLSNLHLSIKKASCVEVDLFGDTGFGGELVQLLPPRTLRRLAKKKK